MSSFTTDFSDYILSGHALLHVSTFEKDRVIGEIVAIAEKIERKVHIWSIAYGWTDTKGISVGGKDQKLPVEDHLEIIPEFGEGVICILKDFAPYLHHQTYPGYDVVISLLDELRKIVSGSEQTIVFVGHDFDIPKALVHDITRLDFDLPDNEAIRERIDFVCRGVEREDGTQFKLDEQIAPKVVDACRGMTSSEVADSVALVLRKHKGLDEDALKSLRWEKASIIRSSGLLTYIEPPVGGLENVGGYDALKQHILLDKPCFTDEAKRFGINPPKGFLAAGIPGCGKTLLANSIASELDMPLVSMNVGQLMNKFVGESESNMRSAIKMIESISPCVVLLDEIEKSFGGNSDLDGGSSRRIFGSFLSWMNDRESSVYIIATANRVQALPIEFTRTGRFDVIFGLDLPYVEERKEIFSIHLKKKNRQPAKFDLTTLSKSSSGYTGSDIEQCVSLGLKIAFGEHQELQTQHLQKAISETIPLSKTNKKQIEEIRQWCDLHAKAANPHDKTVTSRKVSLS